MEIGVTLEFRGEETVASYEKCNMSMIESKMVTNLLNCGVSYYTMCNKSQVDCQKMAKFGQNDLLLKISYSKIFRFSYTP